jgi:DNA-directed RNA polymerase subunit RPC12/RpoP
MSTYRCPNCKTEIPDTGISSKTMGSQLRQHTQCPSCKMRLVRNPESPVPELRDWRENEDKEPDDAS